MAISFQFGDGAQNPSVLRDLVPWAYGTGWRSVTNNGSTVRLTDIRSPLDKKTTIKMSLSKIANVYTTLAEGSVPVAEQNANVTGQTVFTELKTIATKVVNGTTIQLPMVARIELRLPNDPDILESDVQKLVLAAYAALCDDVGECVVVTEKMRGALVPPNVL